MVIFMLLFPFAVVCCLGQNTNCDVNPEERVRCDVAIKVMQIYAVDNIFRIALSTGGDAHSCGVICFTIFQDKEFRESEKLCGGKLHVGPGTSYAIDFCGKYQKFVAQTLETKEAPLWTLENKNFPLELVRYPIEKTLLTVILDAILDTRSPSHLLNLNIILEVTDILKQIGKNRNLVERYIDTHVGGQLSFYYPKAATSLLGVYRNVHDKVLIRQIADKMRQAAMETDYPAGLRMYILPALEKAKMTVACTFDAAQFPRCIGFVC